MVVAGAGGFLGRWLVPDLESRGFEVVRLVRNPRGDPGPGAALWDPEAHFLDPRVLEGAFAVVNLAGRNVAAARWTAAERERLVRSRLDSTATLVEAMGRCDHPPGILVNASAVGYYGHRGEEELDESSAPGSGFLADLARRWEAAALEAAPGGVRVVLLRLGMVVGRGGALERMLPVFRLGLGGPVGGGRQWRAWVSLEDVLGAIRHVMETGELQGPVNVVSPCAVRERELAAALGSVLRRPAVLPLPASAARLALGPMAGELLLASQKVLPRLLQATGYRFRLPGVTGAIRAALD